MKKSFFHTLIILSILLVGGLTGCQKSNQERQKEVVVYTYDSFCGEWGAGPEIARLFEEKTGIRVNFVDCGDGGEILSKAVLEKKDPFADVLLGLDNNLSDKASESGVLVSYKAKGSENLAVELNSILTPYDYSNFAFIYNTTSDIPAPTCLEDLTKDIYKKKIILMDPRTSTPGLGFETWAKTVYGKDFDDYMKRLEPSVLTLAPGWSVGYGMFTKGEAPLVISYETSPAYHIEYNEGDQFKALKFTDKPVMQIEGAGIVKGAKNLEGAKKFIDFLISDEAQNLIPLTQWMIPANKNVVLPKCYDGIVIQP